MSAPTSSWTNRVRLVVAILALIALSPLILVGLAMAPFILGWDRWQAARLRRRFERKWRPLGKTGLLVYSNSPHWQAYIESQWLPALADRLVVLNWSERHRWPEIAPLEARVHRHWAGQREFNPVAIVFRDGERPAVVRFWRAFRDYKHGKTLTLRAAEEDLGSLLGADWRAGGMDVTPSEARGPKL